MRQAHKNARKGKRWYKEVQMIDNNSEPYLLALQNSLIDKAYNTSNYDIFNIVDKGKERTIYKLPYYPDRICQWAIMQQIEHIFINTFIYDTYASMPNRGIHLGLKRITKAMQDKQATKYCLKLDIKKFFPSINHDILKKLLRKKFKDKDLLWLLDNVIDSTNKGIPIGNYLSQYFANFYLCYFDHWMKEKMQCKYYYRYMDDIVVLHHSKDYLHKLLRKIKFYLWENLKLLVKGNWQVFATHTRGLDFIGYRMFGNYTLLRKSTATNLKRKMNKISKKQKLNFSEFCSINSYLGWTKWANAFHLAKQYLYPNLKKELILCK